MRLIKSTDLLPPPPPEDPDDFVDKALTGVCQYLAFKNEKEALSLIASADLAFEDREEYECGKYSWVLCVKLPVPVYADMTHEQRSAIEKTLEGALDELFPWSNGVTSMHRVNMAKIKPLVLKDPGWREAALTFLRGGTVSNQGAPRPDRVAPRLHDDLRFRSKPEEHVYDAAKAVGVIYSPNAVLVCGGQRIEVDGLILRAGRLMVLEIDGPFHQHETAAEADARTRILRRQGVYVVHIAVDDCDAPEKALKALQRALEDFDRFRQAN